MEILRKSVPVPPINLWEYVQQYHKSDYSNFPTSSDRDRKGQESHKKEIWDYFFSFAQLGIDEIRSKELSKLRLSIDKQLENRKAKKEKLEGRLKKINESISKESGSNEISGTSKLVEQKKIVKAEIDRIKVDISQFERSAKQYFSSVEKNFEKLINLIPTPPSDESIEEAFNESVLQIEKGLLNKAKVGTGIMKIPYFDNAKEEQVVINNLTSFISPGFLYLEKIPDSYKPVEQRLLDRLNIFSSTNLNSDLAKHLFAKRRAKTKSGDIAIYYGVYKIDFLVIMKDNLILYSCFFDFIRGEIIYEKMSEIYYQDIVSIEIVQEEFHIQLNYSDNKNPPTVMVPAVPSLTINLNNNKSEVITFANKAYFVNVIQQFRGQGKEFHSKNQEFINSSTNLAIEKARAVIRSLRGRIRKHKMANL